MSNVLFENDAYGYLSAPVGHSDTVITLNSGEGARFPYVDGSDDRWFPVTLAKDTGENEIAHCFKRVGDTLEVRRGMEGTEALSFDMSSIVEIRLTKESLDALVSGTTASIGRIQLLDSFDTASGLYYYDFSSVGDKPNGSNFGLVLIEQMEDGPNKIASQTFTPENGNGNKFYRLAVNKVQWTGFSEGWSRDNMPQATKTEVLKNNEEKPHAYSPKTFYDAVAFVDEAFKATITLDLLKGLNFKIKSTGNFKLENISNSKSGCSGHILIEYAMDNKITFGTAWKFPFGSPDLPENQTGKVLISYLVVSSTEIIATMVKGYLV